MSEVYRTGTNPYGRPPEPPYWTPDMTRVSRRNNELMAEVKGAHEGRRGLLVGRRAVQAAERNLKMFVGRDNNMYVLHEIASYEDAERDLAAWQKEWERPKELSEFTNEEMQKAGEYRVLEGEIRAGKRELSRQTLRELGGPMGGTMARYEVSYMMGAEGWREAAQQLGLTEDEAHRLRQAIAAGDRDVHARFEARQSN